MAEEVAGSGVAGSGTVPLVARLRAACAGTAPGDMLRRLYWDGSALDEPWFAALADALGPLDHVSCVHMLENAAVEPLPSVVALLAFLRRRREQGEWAHFHLTQALARLWRAGVAEARLPLAVHAGLAAECFTGNDYVRNMPQALLAAAVAAWSPREGVRQALQSVRMGNALALQDVAGALERLGLLPASGRFDAAAAREVNEALGAGVGFADTGVLLGESAAVSSVPVALPRTVTHPAPEGDAHFYQFKRAGTPIPVEPVFVHRVGNATVSCDHTRLGRPGLYVFAEGQNLRDLNIGTEPFVAEQPLSAEKPLLVVDDVFSGVPNVSHLLFDQVPRLLAYRRLHPGPATLLQVDDSPYHRGALEALGVGDVLRPQERRFSVRAPVAFLCSNAAARFDHPLNNGAARTAALVRDAFGVSDARGRGRRLYVSRADAGSRRAVNASAVEEVVRRHGFEVVTLSGLSFAQQRDMFAEASHVAGVHGAGLSNVVFSPADCRVFEILPPLVASHTYWMLCGAIGQRYRAFIAADPELPTPASYDGWAHDVSFNNRDVVVDPGRLHAALAEFV